MATTGIDFTAMDEGTADTGADQGFEHTADVSTGGEQHGQDQQQGAGGAGGEDQADGRRGSIEHRNAARAAIEALPEHAKAIREMAGHSFRLNEYRDTFPTVNDAKSAKQLIEGIGGVEGATALQSRIQAVDQQDEAIKAGSPEVIDAMFKDFPEGAAALGPHYLATLQKTNPEAYSSTVAPHAIAMLEQAGLSEHLTAMANEADPAKAKQMAAQAAAWLNGQKSTIQQTRQQPAKDPRQDKIAQGMQELETQRESMFMEGVTGKVNSSVTPEITKTVEQYAKQYKWNPEQKAEFQSRLQNDIVEQMKADKTYEQQVALRKANKGRTHDTVAGYIAGEFNRRLGDKEGALATAAKFNKLIGKTGAAPTTGVVKAGTPNTAPGGGPLLVSQRPSDSQLDLSRPGADMLLIQGRGYTKDGRFVTWRK